MSHRVRHHIAPDFRLYERLPNGEWIPVLEKKSRKDHRKLDGGS